MQLGKSTSSLSIVKQEEIDLLPGNEEDKEVTFYTQAKTPFTSNSIVPKERIEVILVGGCKTEEDCEETCIQFGESSSRTSSSTENPVDTIAYWKEKYLLSQQKIQSLQERVEHLSEEIDHYNKRLMIYFTPAQIRHIKSRKGN